MELLTAAQMRAIEQAAVESGEVTGLELMERAGRGVVEAVFDWRPELAASPGKAVVLCGPGNNGGDGFVVARLLSGQGWDVQVYLFGDEAKLPPDAAENCRRWQGIGAVSDYKQRAAADELEITDAQLIIDALFGGGLTRPIGPLNGVPKAISDLARNERSYGRIPPKVIAIDAPSGMCLDSGTTLGPRESGWEVISADLTVTFHTFRVGHFLNEAGDNCGEVRVVDIGLGPSQISEGRVTLIEGPRDEVSKTYSYGHKYTHGHALILSGGVGKGGAARLAARAALRVGAGVVTVGAPSAAIIENAAQLNAIMLCPVDDVATLSNILSDDRITAIALGPGKGIGALTRDLMAVALQSSKRGVVLDADALTSFRDDPLQLFELTKGKKAVLTPHMGEFASLFPDIHARLMAPAMTGPAFSKVDAAREAAVRAGCVVLLKGPDTVVSSPTGAASIISAQYDRACPWLATAGAGDVLAGMIAGFLARGFEPKSAAESAAWLHQEAARSFGSGLIAEDLPEELPKVFRALGL